MEIDDFTYEHQIINQAEYLLNSENGGKINDTQLLPKNIFAMKIFGYLIHSEKILNSNERFKDLNQIIDENLNSRLTQGKLSKFCNKLKEDLSNFNQGGVVIKDILDQMEFLILLSFIDNDASLKFKDDVLMGEMIEKLKSFGTYNDFLFLLETYNGKYDKDTFPSLPEKDIIVEALLQLKLNQLIKSDNITRDFYRKIKTRKLLFIKEVHDKLDLFKNKSIFKPAPQLIYEVVMASSVLILLSYNKTISLNKHESQIYIDKEIDSKMIESEIQSTIERGRKDILTFSIHIHNIETKFRVSLFLALLVYVIIWAIFSGFLYYHVFSGYYWDIIFSVLLIYTVFFLYESYEKTYGKKNKIK